MGDTACFFVDDKTVADALKSKSHRITCRDGSKVIDVSMNYILNLSRDTKKHCPTNMKQVPQGCRA